MLPEPSSQTAATAGANENPDFRAATTRSINNLRIRRLSSGEMRSRVLPLRLQVFGGELGWTKPHIKTCEQMLDRYDQCCSQLGVWWGETLVGACRVVTGDEHRPLPAQIDIGESCKSGQVTAEISKLLVIPAARGLRIGQILLLASCIEACRRQAELLFITVVQCPRKIANLRRLGFCEIVSGHDSDEGVLNIPIRMSTLTCILGSGKTAHFQMILDDECNRSSTTLIWERSEMY